VLVVFSGLPGVGKTTLARSAAVRLSAALVRIDMLDSALRRAGIAPEQPIGVATYLAANAVSEACLRVGTPVVVDGVNALEVIRDGWRGLASRTGAPLRVVEVICSDASEHRRRVESRAAELEGVPAPTWADVGSRMYEPWRDPRLVVDTAVPLADCEREIDDYLRTERAGGPLSNST
jgi:predicted kinase